MFAPVTISAAAAAPASLPAGTYTYRATINGAASGTAKITVSPGPNGTIVISENTSGQYQGISASATASYTIAAADGTPMAYTASYQGEGQAATSSVTFNGSQAAVKSPQSSRSFTLPAGTAHFVIADGALLSGFIGLPLQMHDWNAAPAYLIAPVYGQGMQIAPDAAPKADRPHGVPAADVALSVGGQVPFTLWYDPATYLTDELDVPSQHIVIARDRQ